MEKEGAVSVVFRIMSVISLFATMVVGCRNFFVEKDIKEIQTAQGQIQFER